MFNSQKINTDPKPWHNPSRIPARSVNRRGESSWAMGDAYRPRPEYDNNPNPILVDFRRSLGIQERGSVAAHARWWVRLRDIEPDMTAECWSDPPIAFTEEHYAHAWKVLQRLANLS